MKKNNNTVTVMIVILEDINVTWKDLLKVFTLI